MFTAGDQVDIGLMVVGPEHQLRGIGENQADSHRHQDLHEVGAITHGYYQRHVDEITKNK